MNCSVHWKTYWNVCILRGVKCIFTPLFAAGATLCPTNVTTEAVQEEPEFDVDYYVPDFESLYEFANEKQVHFWIQKWREMRYYDEPDSSVRDWFDSLKKFHGPRVIGREECTMAFNLFLSKVENLPKEGSFVRQGDSCPPSRALWVKGYSISDLQTKQLSYFKSRNFIKQNHAYPVYCNTTSKKLIVTLSTSHSIRTSLKQYTKHTNIHVSCLSIHTHAHKNYILACFFISCFM